MRMEPRDPPTTAISLDEGDSLYTKQKASWDHVLVCSGGCHKMPQTEWLVNYQTFISHGAGG